MLGRCFVPPGVRVSCTTTTGSDASARRARVSITRITVTNASLMPRETRSRRRDRQCPEFDTGRWAERAPRSVELDVGLAQEGLGHRLTRLAACLSPDLQTLRVAGHERSILGA